MLNNIHRGINSEVEGSEFNSCLSWAAKKDTLKIDCLSYAWPPVCLTREKARKELDLKAGNVFKSLKSRLVFQSTALTFRAGTEGHIDSLT